MSTDPTLVTKPTTGLEFAQERRFAASVLPWVVAAGALVVYLLTLNHWVSPGSLQQTARLSGWTWQADSSAPLYWLLTLPLQWLSPRLVPLALNLFATACAVLTLALLARSVALLPHDRTKAQRDRERGPYAFLSTPTAWVPPLAAALLCGLQITFWESATAATAAYPSNSGPMLDVLLFAYVVRCLLEYRVDERDSWLTRASLVMGIGMTNDWAMVGFFPAFLIALVWIKGIGFFNSGFLLRMFGWGLAGLSLYLLLPLTQHFQGAGGLPFWTALKFNLVQQKNILLGLPFNRHMLLDREGPMLLILAAYSLLPVLLMGVRWSSHFGDTSPTGTRLASLVFHVAHAMFLLVCVWVLLDPPFSPRNKGGGMQFLSLYYLTALSVGYLTGYFLLVFGQPPANRFSRNLPGALRALNGAILVAVWLVLAAAPLVQLYRNLPQIRFTNGPMLTRYVTSLAENIPPAGAVLLSDESSRLLLLEAFLARDGKASGCVFVDTPSLRYPEYHQYMKRTYGSRWPVTLPDNVEGFVPDISKLELLARLSQTNALYYLHPSFGYYFEVFHATPRGLVYRLEPYAKGEHVPPPLTADQVRENESFWSKETQDVLDPLVNTITPPAQGPNPGLVATLMDRLHLKSAPSREALGLAALYTPSLVSWGVALQKQGMLTNAAARFETALDLNPDNVVARVDLDVNKLLQSGRKGVVPASKAIEDEFGKYHNWERAIQSYGPFDEANRCYELGMTFALGGNYRQAAQLFLRAQALDPENSESLIALAQVYLAGGRYADGLEIVQRFRSDPKLLPARKQHEADLLFVESNAYFGQTNYDAANAAIQAALRDSPGDEALCGVACQSYIRQGWFTNALAVIDAQLKYTPDHPLSLSTKGFLCLRLGLLGEAVTALTHLVDTSTDTSVLANARLNRAIAYFRTDKLDEAKADYEYAQQTLTNSFAISYGLGEIAFRKKDTNAAIQYYQRYLSSAPPDTDEARSVAARLKELQPGPR